MWIKGNEVFDGSIVYNGRRVINPSDAQLIEAGYTWSEPVQDTREWVDKEVFVNAVYSLVPAEVIPTVLADPKTAKSAIASMVLLTTAAAPGNMVDIDDPRVAQWLSVSGVTVDEVKQKMEELDAIG